MPEDVETYLQASACINRDAAAVITLVSSLVNARQTDLEKAVTLYY